MKAYYDDAREKAEAVRQVKTLLEDFLRRMADRKYEEIEIFDVPSYKWEND